MHLRSYNGRRVRVSVECPIPHFSVQTGAREPLWPLCALDTHWCELAADFYPTVKAALLHESADSEEDRKGLGYNLGQGLSWLLCF